MSNTNPPKKTKYFSNPEKLNKKQAPIHSPEEQDDDSSGGGHGKKLLGFYKKEKVIKSIFEGSLNAKHFASYLNKQGLDIQEIKKSVFSEKVADVKEQDIKASEQSEKARSKDSEVTHADELKQNSDRTKAEGKDNKSSETVKNSNKDSLYGHFLSETSIAQSASTVKNPAITSQSWIGNLANVSQMHTDSLFGNSKPGAVKAGVTNHLGYAAQHIKGGLGSTLETIAKGANQQKIKAEIKQATPMDNSLSNNKMNFKKMR